MSGYGSNGTRGDWAPSRHHALRLMTAAILVVGAPLAAQAHPDPISGSSGLITGLLHPVTGLDHLLAFLAVGLWCSAGTSRTSVTVVVAVLAGMMIGAGTALRGLAIPFSIEPMILATLLVLGLGLAFNLRTSLPIAVGLATLFATIHGYTHGLEIPVAAAPGIYAGGLLIGTAMLVGFGAAVGVALRRLDFGLCLRIAGSVLVGTGVVLAAGL